MSFFSKSKKAQSETEAIPPEVLRSVRTMNDPHPAEKPLSPEEDAATNSKKTFQPGSSPFLAEQPTIKITSEKKPSKNEMFIGSGLPPATSGTIGSYKPKKRHWVIWSLCIFLLLFLLLAFSYWFFVIKPVSEKELNNREDSTVEVINTMPPVPGPASSPYSTTTPNFLPIDTEEVTLEDFKKSLTDAGNRIVEAKIAEPVEFIITDKKNNPLAFSRLAYLTNITLSPELLSMLGESFVLYLYNDAGRSHVGLSLALSNPEQARLLIQKEEPSVPSAFQKLFFPDVVVPEKVNFRSGSYSGSEVRFVNIDEAANYSVDYTLREEKWLIGTSKNTLRMLFDKK